MPPLPTLYIFGDESGDLTFSNKGSEYFVVSAVTMRNSGIAQRLLDLRHELALQGQALESFHAINDGWPIRHRVFTEIQQAQLDIDAVILHKRKTKPHIAANVGYFYQLAWHFLFQYVAPRRCQRTDDLLVAAASLSTIEKKQRFSNALDSVVRQHNVCQSVATGFWGAATHPCLQVADYCAWAVQRWKALGDKATYNLIGPQIRSCYEPFAGSAQIYY